jgi:D-arabinose 1-dehydrogenase-like Zn-dependent alcohol dehydrogenase
MASYRAFHFAEIKGTLKPTERTLQEPGPGQVLLKVLACGCCHSDLYVSFGIMNAKLPRVPGHEVVGIVQKVGDGVKRPAVGQTVGVGWHGGHCFTCTNCRRGDFILCSQLRITGFAHDGGYAEYMISPAEACALVPEGMDPEQAAPLMCAGVTVFNALRKSGAVAGDVVAVHSLGGLGHLAIQFARKMGFVTVAISGSADKEKLAKELGAHYFIDLSKQKVAEELQKHGGAKVILCCGSNADAMSEAQFGLGSNGNMVILGVDMHPVKVEGNFLLNQRRRVSGHPSGFAQDSEETLRFAHLFGVKSQNELFEFKDTQQAFERAQSGKAKFRVVIKH